MKLKKWRSNTGLYINKHRFFKRFLIFSVIFVCYTLAYEMISDYVKNRTPLQLFNIHDLQSQDFEFNDIFYFTRENDKGLLRKDVVLVNIGTLNRDPSVFRKELVKNLQLIQKYHPKVIGLDIVFKGRHDEDPLYDLELEHIIRSKKIIAGCDTINPFFSTRENPYPYLGNISLPIEPGKSVREYYGSKDTLVTFAGRIVQCYKPGVKTIQDSVMLLKYNCVKKGFYNIMKAQTEGDQYNFPAIEASDIIAEKDTALLRKTIEDKAIIYGLLGNFTMDSKCDIEDKQKVPVDFNLVNRLPIMPGVVIHANAVQMLVNENDRLFPINTLLLYLTVALIGFPYLIFTMAIAKWNIFLKIAVKPIVFGLLTLGIIWLGIKLMNTGYYFSIGYVMGSVFSMEGFSGTAEDIIDTLFKVQKKKLNKKSKE